MNSTLSNIKHFSVLLTTASALFAFAQPAKAITNLSPTDFSLSSGSSGQANAVSGNNAIDDASFGTKDGFGDVFSTDFLLLGATNSATTITSDGVEGNNSTAESITFALTDTELSGTIDVDFTWAFNGNSLGIGGFDQDNFSITFRKVGDLSATKLVLSKAATAGYGTDTESVSIDATGLTAGDYFLQITLNENSATGTSSAAGFNQIIVTPNPAPDPDPTPVPFEASPTLGLLMVGGIYGVNRLRKSKK